MLPPSSSAKGTPHGVGMPGSLAEQQVGQTPKYINQGHGGGVGLASLNYNSNQSQSNGSLSILPQDPIHGGKLYLPSNVDSRQLAGRDSGG